MKNFISACTICPAGSQCGDKTIAPVACGNGYYSLKAYMACVQCPAGFSCATKIVLPIACNLGYYALAGSLSCTQCPAGSYCGVTTNSPVGCSSGYYALAGATYCSTCPGGKLCDQYTGVGASCSTGYYLLPLTNSASCNQCPTGWYCPDVVGNKLACASGTYSDYEATTCTICPAGSYCPTQTLADKTLCLSGTYSDEGQISCTSCPDGFTCIGPGVSSPTKCGAGTYSAANSLSCTNCQATYACPEAYSANKYQCAIQRTSAVGQSICTVIPDDSYCSTRNPVNIFTCAAKQYLVGYSCVSAIAGQYYVDSYTTPKNCPGGWYSAAGDTSCTICPAGKNCPNIDGSGISNCIAGTYSNPGTSTGCTDCPIGRCCPNTNSPLQKECDAGYYAPNTRMTACIACPANYFCLDKKTATACPANYYSLSGWESCRPCPGGQSCLTSPPSDCGTGSYSPEGDANCYSCPKGNYCPLTRNTMPSPCVPGTARNALGSSSCATCSLGYFSGRNAFTCTACPNGYYCPVRYNPPIICPLGTYSNGAVSSCSDCNDGYICLPGSTNQATPSTQLCPKGFYCIHSTVDTFSILKIVPCPAGKYGIIDGGSTEANGCQVCPLGTYCPNQGMTVPLACPKGTICSSTGLANRIECSAGNYNPIVGMSLASSCLTCPPGNYCPQGSPDPIPCPPGYVCPAGTTMYSTKCPDGSWVLLKPVGSVGECNLCPKGSYCIGGTGAPTYCPSGTYNEFTGKTLLTDCLKCDAGTACPKLGNIKSYSGIICPPGYYCPAGTAYPTQYPCLAGTYSNEHKLIDNTLCLPCPEGYACSEATNRYNNKMLKCAPGFYCPQGSTTIYANPCVAGYYQPYAGTSTIAACTLFKCPPGRYCPQNSTAPGGYCFDGYYCTEGSTSNMNAPCPAGTYSTGPGLRSIGECTICPIGSYCEINSTMAAIKKCPTGTYQPFSGKSSVGDCLTCSAGYYCPIQNGTSMIECGFGYYSGPSATSCLICVSGYYCNSTTTTAAQISTNAVACEAGYICPTGVSEYPLDSLRCPAGAYCLAISVFPITCDPGTYNQNKGGSTSAACIQTPAGFYSLRAATAPAGDCAPGYYCPIGSTTDKMVPCPSKSFRSRTNGESLTDCGPCPAGYYCPVATSIPVPCPIGYYCLPSTDTPIKCPSGYFGGSPMLRDVAQCTPCWSGRFCSQAGLTYPDGRCDPGFYCIKKAVVPNPTDGVTGALCPAGGFCPQGSGSAQPCNPGKYGATSGLSAASQCTSCTQGYYCIGEVRNAPTGQCKAGFNCPAGSKTEMENACSPGYYSQTGASQCTACSPGYYQENYAMTVCTKCPAGYYCDTYGNPGVFKSCTTGHYCPEGTSSPVNCPTGTYNPLTNFRKIEDCVSCTTGSNCWYSTGYPYYMDSLSTPYALCDAGYYCPYGSYSTYNRILCSAGYYCPQGSGVQIPCPTGTYNPYTGRTVIGECLSCSAGSYCETKGLSTPTGQCFAGYYCPAGQSLPRPDNYYCDIGQYCPVGSSVANPCPAGWYQMSKKQGACMKCPKGFFCVQGSTKFDDATQNCPAGYYCPEGTGYSTQYPCPAGTYNPYTNAFNPSQCTKCDPGYYCLNAGRTTLDTSAKCNGGYYCIRGASTASPMDGTTGYRCEPGYYCPVGSSGTIPCPAGLSCPTYYMSAYDAVNNRCSAGYYCPAGSSNNSPNSCGVGKYCPTGTGTPIPCPAGTYSNSATNSARSNCANCQNGKYSANPGSTSCSFCTAGYYCNVLSGATIGFTTPTPNSNVCPKGFYCSYGTADKVACDSTSYQDNLGQPSCKPCPEGYECTDQTKSLCTPNLEKTSFYCPVNMRARQSCGNGYYSVRQGTTTSADCYQCPRGYYCPLNPGATEDKINQCPTGRYCPAGSGTSQGFICDSGYYCPAGTAEEILCPPGYYCGPTGITTPTTLCNAGYWCINGATSPSQNDGTKGRRCSQGFYCPSGTLHEIPCPPGTYRNALGGASLSDCAKCSASQYCYIIANINNFNPCPAGYYCPLGTDKSSKYPCEAGYMCPPSSADHTLCPDNFYQPLPVQSACIACPASFYCQNVDATAAQKPKICPTGKYCIGTSLPQNCPIGKFNPREGIASSAECELCPPGKICDTIGLSAATKLCTAGYFCTSGVAYDPPPGDSTGSSCPIGHYCPAGTTGPIPCPPGTINDATGKYDLTQCLPCPATYFCPYRGKTTSLYFIGTNNNFKCSAGYVCMSGCSSPKPIDGTKGMICIEGTFCPIGASAPTNCLAGTYNPYKGQASCLSCPSGRACPDSGMSLYSNCPTGGYCTTGSSTKINCLAGTYSSNINLETQAGCYPCDPGKYCIGGGDIPTGSCSETFVCPRGAARLDPPDSYSITTNLPGTCPTGNYCPAGSKAPIQCLPGTYQDEIAKVSCKTCPANYYCPISGMTNYHAYPCSAGYICTGGAEIPNPIIVSEGGRPCAEGNYCPLDSVTHITVEIPCPAGTYEPRKGSLQCQTCPAGFYCLQGAMALTVCPATKYCPASTIDPIVCPNGTYSNIPGLYSSDQCRFCPSGEYCWGGMRKGACSPGFYCVSNASKPDNVSMICPAGAYCSIGSTKPTVCPVGKVRQLPGAVSDADCTSCGVGYYCIPGSPTPFACPKGHYCPLQTPTPIPCPIGKYSTVELATSLSQCISCPAGYFCNEEGVADLNFVQCPPGYYCSNSSQAPVACPKGTFFNNTRATSKTDCMDCPEGFYCKEATITPIICPQGTYCLAGGYQALPCPAKYFCRYTPYNGKSISKILPCPGAYYCPDNTIDPKKCDNGFFCPPLSSEPTPCPSGTAGNNYENNDDIASGCTVCQPGTYSKYGSFNTKCKPCTAGYVCLMGALTDKPIDKYADHGYECPKGYYCPEGSYEPTSCPSGTFTNKLRGSSVDSCMKCEAGTYNDVEGQQGCKTCGPSSTSDAGKITCSCYGKNRVFQMSNAKCLCMQYFTSVQFGDTEDSKKDCKPVIMARCAFGQLRDSYGNCVAPDDCEKECKGKPGKRSPGIGFCECSEIKDTDSICNATCRANAPVLTVSSTGSITTKSSSYSGTDTIKASSKILGEPKCPAGGCKIKSISMSSSGGFSADYNPSAKLKAAILKSSRLLSNNETMARRFLEETSATSGITNPAICVNLGDSITFDIPDADHYPIYSKDAMANSNPNFDYSAFITLESRIKGGDVPELFIFTFNQAGVYVLADHSDVTQLTIISVMGKTEQCPSSDKSIVPITGANLIKLGVAQKENITLEPDWLFIGCCFIVILIVVPGVVVVISFLHNIGKKTKKNLAAINFSKTQQPPLSSDRAGLLGTPTNGMDLSEEPLNKFNKTMQEGKAQEEDGEVDPGIFDEIYDQLKSHAKYVKEEFVKKASIDNENINKVWEHMKELKKGIKNKLKAIATIFGKNVKYLFSKKKKAEELKTDEAEEVKVKAKEEQEEEDEESDYEGNMERIVEIIEAKNADDLKELAKIQEQEDVKLSEFMKNYVEDQSHKLEAFKDKVIENATISDFDKQELLKQYENQLQDLQKQLLLYQKDQQIQLKIRLDGRKNNRGQLATQLDKLNAQKKDLIKLVKNQLRDLDDEFKRAEKRVTDEADAERKQIEGEVEARKTDALKKARNNLDKKMSKVSDPRKRTELLEQFEKSNKEIEKLYEDERKAQLKDLLEKLEVRVREQKEQLKINYDQERASLKDQKKVQLERIKDLEIIISNKLGNVAIDEKLTEAIESDKMKTKEEEAKYDAEKEEHLRKLEDITNAEKEKLSKIRDDYNKDEDMIKEDYEVQKRILTSATKKKSEDLIKQKEKHMKELNKGLLTEEDETRVKAKIKELEETLGKRIEEEILKQDKIFQEKLREKKKLKAQREANQKETTTASKANLNKEWDQKEDDMRSKMRKEKLRRLIDELKTRTKGEELPIAVENTIESIHMEELTDLLGKHYREKAYTLSDKVGELIQNKLIEVHKIKEEMEGQFQRLKESFEKEQITQFDFDRRLRDLQSRENDLLRDVELEYIQKQNEMERDLCGKLAETQEQELIKLREGQSKEKKDTISEIVLFITGISPNMQANIQTIVGGSDAEGNIREMEDYKEQLRGMREKKMAELDRQRMRLQNIAIENEDFIKHFNEGTKKMLDQQTKREREKEEKRKVELEKSKKGHESKLKLQQGLTEADRQKLLDEYSANVESLTSTLEAERKRQASKMMEKLEKRLKEKDQLKAQKQIQLATYKMEVADKMEQQVKDSKIKLDTKCEIKDTKTKVVALVEKYDATKTVYDKVKKLEGVENIDELVQIAEADEKEPEELMGGVIVNIDFDGIYEKISSMDERVGDFSEEQFYKIIEGFRVINATLNELKERARAKNKKFEF